MRFYQFLAKAPLPKSYVGKFMVVCFIGTHAPLIAFAVYAVAVLPLDRPLFILAGLILVATLGGTAMSLFAVRALLSPIVAAQRALHAYLKDGQRLALPTDGQDEAGRLLAEIQIVVDHLDGALSDAERQAMTDALTTIGNRRWLTKEAERAIARWQRTHKPLCAIIFDVDHFKDVNDRYGHAAGDAVLRQIADSLREQLRTEDLFARTGGEEFCILVSDTSRDQAHNIAERLRWCIRNLRCGAGGDAVFSVTASFGVVAASADHRTFASIFAAADKQLYDAKRGGRDRVCTETDPADIRVAAA